ncbi:hypothetical protein CBS115989_10368 [Aspergillus niger]|nr:hypothetical protein CBS115989_10368 [Aspergillus niger]KAI2836161.1 hypothetical protein CBS11232_10271 [Aspergillus niger]KAI2874235.1 hypothetical protein CBS115988_6345 [Aspergillus niger]
MKHPQTTPKTINDPYGKYQYQARQASTRHNLPPFASPSTLPTHSSTHPPTSRPDKMKQVESARREKHAPLEAE